MVGSYWINAWNWLCTEPPNQGVRTQVGFWDSRINLPPCPLDSTFGACHLEDLHHHHHHLHRDHHLLLYYIFPMYVPPTVMLFAKIFAETWENVITDIGLLCWCPKGLLCTYIFGTPWIWIGFLQLSLCVDLGFEQLWHSWPVLLFGT